MSLTPGNDSASGGIGTISSYQLDAFGAMRVAAPFTLAENQVNYPGLKAGAFSVEGTP